MLGFKLYLKRPQNYLILVKHTQAWDRNGIDYKHEHMESMMKPEF